MLFFREKLERQVTEYHKINPVRPVTAHRITDTHVREPALPRKEENVIVQTPPQVLPPAQRHPVGRHRSCHGDRVRLRPEGGGEPPERELQGARPLPHPGVRGQHGGRRGLHALLHQRYRNVLCVCVCVCACVYQVCGYWVQIDSD